MSRIGRHPIAIPAGVTVTVSDDNHVVVKGPKGQLEQTVNKNITVKVEGNEVHVTRPNDEKQNRAFHGLYRALIANMVVGVTDSLLEGETLIRLAADLNLLASLGLRLVLVHGSRHLLDKLASGRNFVPKYSGSRRITDEATLMEVKQVAGIIRSDVEAALNRIVPIK